MRIVLTGTNLTLTDGIRDHVMQKLAASLDRVESRIDQVRVRLSDINGPHKGNDKRCHLEVTPRARPKVVLEEIADDLYQAIDGACGRVKSVLHRKLARRR